MVEKINAIASVQPPAYRSGTDASLPAPGDTIRLSLAEIAGDHVLATTADGLSLRLTGLDRLAGDMMPGDLLLVRVLAAQPSLTLSLVDKLAVVRPGGTDFAGEPAAMRADQLALRHVTWPAPDAATLATVWRAQVMSGLEQRAAWNEQRASAIFIAGLQDAGATLRQDPPQHQPPLPDYWMFPVNGWAGSPVQLRLLESDVDEMPRLRRRAAILRLELELPELGRVAVLVQLIAGGVSLVFEVQQDSTLDFMRGSLPAISAALARAGLPVRRCRLGHMPAAGAPSDGTHLATWTADMLPPALFRAAAEVMLTLSSAASS